MAAARNAASPYVVDEAVLEDFAFVFMRSIFYVELTTNTKTFNVNDLTYSNAACLRPSLGVLRVDLRNGV